MTARSISWPTAAVLIIAVLAIVATALAGPSLGLDPETITLVVGGEGLLGSIVAGIMRALLSPPAAPTPSDEETGLSEDAGGGALGLLLAAVVVSALMSGCSALPVATSTTPVVIKCEWHVPIGTAPTLDASIQAPSGVDGTAGIIIADNDCTIDRTETDPSSTTTGNDQRGMRVDPSLTANVPLTGGTGQ